MFYFHPETWGNDSNLTWAYLNQMGWLQTPNQQLDGEDGIIENPAAAVDIVNLTCFFLGKP